MLVKLLTGCARQYDQLVRVLTIENNNLFTVQGVPVATGSGRRLTVIECITALTFNVSKRTQSLTADHTL